jgi:hypothetical protein
MDVGYGVVVVVVALANADEEGDDGAAELDRAGGAMRVKGSNGCVQHRPCKTQALQKPHAPLRQSSQYQ